ncbi:MAG: hypothetical protein CVV46_16790 [Spirochaetae bacterium HGW-Spirochaetae-2]|nr:MAG: hypothetical protein CVV46_16790 [Spirochaetae bacterium HGW-Spirochaetae-2]
MRRIETTITRRHLLDFPSSGVAEADIVFPDGELGGVIHKTDMIVTRCHQRGIHFDHPHSERFDTGDVART